MRLGLPLLLLLVSIFGVSNANADIIFGGFTEGTTYVANDIAANQYSMDGFEVTAFSGATLLGSCDMEFLNANTNNQQYACTIGDLWASAVPLHPGIYLLEMGADSDFTGSVTQFWFNGITGSGAFDLSAEAGAAGNTPGTSSGDVYRTSFSDPGAEATSFLTNGVGIATDPVTEYGDLYGKLVLDFGRNAPTAALTAGQFAQLNINIVNFKDGVVVPEAPEPSTIWLAGSSMIGLIALKARRSISRS